MARRELIEALERAEPRAYGATVYRQLGFGYQALSGEGARALGGRWNPPASFPVLYTSPSPDVLMAEIVRKARKEGFPPEQLLPRRLITYEVELLRVLDLTDPRIQKATGLHLPVFTDDDIRLCQAIGEAAHYMGFEGVLAPSAATSGDMLAIYLDQLLPGSIVRDIAEDLIERLA